MELLFDVENLCRTCLGVSERLISVFTQDLQHEIKISAMIACCSSMKIEQGDGFPLKVCYTCVQAARSSYSFQQQCNKSYDTLRSFTAKREPTDGGPSNEIAPVVKLQGALLEIKAHDEDTALEMESNEATEESIEGFEEIEHGKHFENVEYLVDACLEVEAAIKQETSGEDIKIEAEEISETEYYELDLHQTGEDCWDYQTVLVDHESESNAKMQHGGVTEGGNTKQFQCDKCHRVLSRASHLKRHMLTHSDVKPFHCLLCSRKFSRADHLQMHMNFHSKARPYVCSICKKSFKRAEHLKNHRFSFHAERQTAGKSEICEICERGFCSPRFLEKHMMSHLEQKSFPCKYCKLQYADKKSYSEHLRTHIHERPYLCSECGQRFVRNDYLIIHMRRHNGEKPYKCRFCHKAFPRATDLTVHERYHTNEKKHLCTTCGKSFHRAYNLIVHMRIHTGEKPYKCPYCTKTFIQGNDLKAHVRRHTGELHKCETCGEGFLHGYHLKNHRKNVHNIDTGHSVRRVEKYVTPLAQQQQVLQQQHTNQLERLQSLKIAAKMEDGTGKTEEEYEREIVATSDRMAKLKQQLEEIAEALSNEVCSEDE